MSHHGLSADHLSVIKGIIRQHAPRAERAALFGSRAAGAPRPCSPKTTCTRTHIIELNATHDETTTL